VSYISDRLSPMKEFLLVGTGSFIGGACRYYLGSWMLQESQYRFPFDTFVVNILGCLLIGAVAGITETQHPSSLLRLFLMTGMLGGFTTFSAFGYETITLIRTGALGVAFSYVTLSVILSLIAVAIGLRLTG